MFAVVGLGNPGPRYEQTRHNAGARALQRLAELLGQRGARWEQKFGCSFLRAAHAGGSYLLVLPQKFMNLSGEAVVPLLRFFKIEPEKVIVLYDELDFDPGVLRIKQGGSAGGHNGLEDMLRHLGSDKFYRIRIGIGHPRRASSSMDVSAWVLSQPGPEEKELIEDAVQRAAEAVIVLATDGLQQAQQRFHS